MFRTNDDFSLFEPISKPIYCGRSAVDCTIQTGSIILYRECVCVDARGNDAYSSRVGRVLGRWTRYPNGETPEGVELAVLALSDDLTHAYMRSVKVEDIVRVRSQEGFGATLLFVLFGEAPDPDEARRVCSYGAMSDNYITEYLRGDQLVFNEVRKREQEERIKRSGAES